jgi:hypothetical protein
MSTLSNILWARALGTSTSAPDSVLRPPKAEEAAIPSSSKRMVWVRDEGRCTFTDSEGERCGATEALGVDPIVALEQGGRARAANLRLRCAWHAGR